MKFVADESVDGPIIDHLRKNHHQVWYVAEMNPGISDDNVLELSNQKEAILLTGDKDFGELVYRQRRTTHGVVLIRLSGLPVKRKAEIVASGIEQCLSKLSNAFTVIMPGSIRIRRAFE